MNKSELVDDIAKQTKMTKADAARSVDAFVTAISSCLKKNQDVRLVGFGTFCVTKRKATQGRNPRTGQKINIPACKTPKFRPGKDLKKVVAG